MADIFSEVEEGLRQDRASALWKRYGPVVIGACVALVAGVAIWQYMQYSRAEAIEASAREYSDAMDLLETDAAAAEAAFAELASEGDGFGILSAHMAAAAAESRGETQNAATHFAGAAEAGEGVYRELAILKSAYLQADDLPIGELEALLTPLLTGAGPSDALARELIAAKALAEGDIERARRDYQTLSLRLDDGNRLPEFQQRVQRAMLVLPPPTVADPASDGDTPVTDAEGEETEDAPVQ